MLGAKNINPLVSVPSSLRENIREDLYVLQASQSRYLFNTAVKWSTKNKAIVKSRLPTIVYLLVVIQWLHSKCSCQHWMKNYFCYHVIYIAVNHKLAQFLDIHMTIPIGQTRSVGRPKGTKENDKQVSSSDSSEKISKKKETQ